MTSDPIPEPAEGSTCLTVSWDAQDALRSAAGPEGARSALASWSAVEDLPCAPSSLQLLSIPSAAKEQPLLAEAARSALAGREDLAETQVTLLGLQGAHLVVAPGFLVVLAEPERLAIAERAAVEACITEAELRRVEAGIASAWAPLRTAAPAAFEVTPETLAQREELKERYGELLDLRRTWSELGPRVMVPHVYPPTLASQVGERLRERLRLHERFELLDPALVAQEQVHGLVAERIGESLNARKGHALEWAIILLLAAEVLLLLAEALIG
ncbi:MAG: hypothetical protein ISQ08_03930 [Planctomycetes bacterium]|nr:hypothetical protein [Planctomycetota bacterium]MDA0948520.1 hypothetical protein [Planctomycetota bacterium]